MAEPDASRKLPPSAERMIREVERSRNGSSRARAGRSNILEFDRDSGRGGVVRGGADGAGSRGWECGSTVTGRAGFPGH